MEFKQKMLYDKRLTREGVSASLVREGNVGNRPGEQGLRGRGGWMLVVGNGTDSVPGVAGHS